jgi:hypothetical protein
MERTRFTLIPVSWLEHPEVGPDEIAVLVVLAHHANPAGQCWPSQARVGSMLGRSRSWVSDVIARLVLLGLIERRRRRSASGGETSCLYTLLIIVPAVIAGDNSPVTAETPPATDGNTELNSPELPDSLSPYASASEPKKAVISESWMPTAEDVAWAKQHAPNIDIIAHTDLFITACQAKGYNYADWSAGWRKWIVEPKGKHLARTKLTSCPTPRGCNGWHTQVSAHNVAVLAEVDQRIAARRTLQIFSEEDQA